MVLSIDNLQFSAGSKQILKGISYRFASGRFYAIAGPNGSGKSTLLKCLCGLEKPTQPSIAINGKQIGSLTSIDRARQMAYIPQQTTASFGFTIKEFVEMGLFPHVSKLGLSLADKQKIETALRLTGVQHLKQQSIQTLSGGELQRAVIARTLAQDSPIMLLDEPFSQLDIHHQLTMLSLFKQLTINQHKLVICILHDFNQLLMFADEVLLLDDGHLVACGKPYETVTPETIDTIFHVATDWTYSAHDGQKGILPIMPRLFREKSEEPKFETNYH